MQANSYSEILKTFDSLIGTAFFELNPSENFSYYTPRNYSMLEYENNEIESTFEAWRDLIFFEDRPFFDEMLKRVMEKETDQYQLNIRFRTKKGPYRWIREKGCAIQDRDNKIKILGLRIDVTEQLTSQQIIEESEIKFHNIFNYTKDGILIMNIKGAYLDSNQSFRSLCEYTEEELQQMSVFTIFHSPDPSFESYRLIYQSIERNQPIEAILVPKGNKKKQIEVNSNIINYQGQTSFLVVVRDVTERKSMEQQILNAIVFTEEKERARLARDLHDGLGPLLSSVKMYSQWIAEPEMKTDKSQLIAKVGFVIDQAIASLKEISNNLSPRLLTSFGLVKAIETFIEPLINNNKISINLDHNLTSRLDENIETALYRILVECINNTLKHSNAKNIFLSILSDDFQIKVIYKDNGQGFDLQKALKGRGMGLSDIQNRVRAMGGEVLMESQEGQGFNLEIQLMLK